MEAIETEGVLSVALVLSFANTTSFAEGKGGHARNSGGIRGRV